MVKTKWTETHPIRKWLFPPHYADEFIAFGAKSLHYTLLVLMAVSAMAFLFASVAFQRLFTLLLLALLGSCFALLHARRIQLSSLLFLSGVWLIITIAAFSTNGVRNASLVGYSIVIIFSAVLMPRWAMLGYTVASILSVVTLGLGETAGILPLNTTPLFLSDRVFQLIGAFLAAGLLLSATAKTITNGIARLQEQEKTLLERNHALESEIFERRRVEAALRASEEKYRLLFENSGVLAMVCDGEGRLLLVNAIAGQVFETSHTALVGRMLSDVFGSAQAQSIMQRLQTVIEQGTSDISDDSMTLPSGAPFHYLQQIIPLPNMMDSSAPSNQVLIITTDLTMHY